MQSFDVNTYTYRQFNCDKLQISGGMFPDIWLSCKILNKIMKKSANSNK